MNRILSGRSCGLFLIPCLAVLSLCAVIASSAQDINTVTLTQISSDPFTVGPGQHATEVEPHVFAFGATEVAAFQTGRIVGGGGTAIGWATSTDSGNTWTHGFLPGLTSGNGGGPYSAASAPPVAFDAKHGGWMVESLPIASFSTPAVGVGPSTDGGVTGADPARGGGQCLGSANGGRGW